MGGEWGLCNRLIGAPGQEKIGGYQLLVRAEVGHCYFFVDLFPNSRRGNSPAREKSALRALVKEYLAMNQPNGPLRLAGAVFVRKH